MDYECPLSAEVARRLVLEFVHSAFPTSNADESYEINDQATVEKEYGWIFFWNTKRFFESGDSAHLILGNGPVLINKYDANIELIDIDKPISKFLVRYERERGFRAPWWKFWRKTE